MFFTIQFQREILIPSGVAEIRGRNIAVIAPMPLAVLNEY